MSFQRPERRLVAALAADLVGYARLMELDEQGTHARLMRLRSTILDTAVEQHGGLLIKNTGDGFLAVFPSAIDAAACALAMQAGLAQSDTGIHFRMGLNVADAIFDAGDVYGDGINVAARLQAYAEPGGIVITAAVADQLQGKLAVRTTDLGDLPLKNLRQPVRAFSLAIAGVRPTPTPGSVSGEARPSIAVLPFRHAPADSEQSYFAEGIVEQVIHALAHLNELFVISHSTTLRYAGQTLDMRVIARELNVRYVLTGSVRRSADRLRITTELSDADQSIVVWTHQFDGDPNDLFLLQDRILMQIVRALVPHVRAHDLQRALRKHPESMDAYDLLLQGLDQLYRMEYASFSRSRGLLQRAISADPGYARAYAYIAKWHVFRVGQGWSPNPAADASEAAQYAVAALERDSGDALALAILGHVHSYLLKDLATGAEYLAQARASSSSNAMAWALSSSTSTYLGHCEDAVAQAERALRLAPLDAHAFFYQATMAHARYWSGAFAEAVIWAERSARHNRTFSANLRCLIAGLMAVGRDADARAYGNLLLKVEPGFNLQDFKVRSPFARLAGYDDFIDRLRTAGLPTASATDPVLRGNIRRET